MTRRELLIVAGAAVGAGLNIVVHAPTMEVTAELREGPSDGSWKTWQPTGHRFYRIDGWTVSESTFFAVAARHPWPQMRDWAHAWRQGRA
jgi:hypothetical protein